MSMCWLVEFRNQGAKGEVRWGLDFLRPVWLDTLLEVFEPLTGDVVANINVLDLCAFDGHTKNI